VERAEEALIVKAAGEGIDILRRVNMSPMALLGITIAMVGERRPNESTAAPRAELSSAGRRAWPGDSDPPPLPSIRAVGANH
jgi:hypothetical protein